MAQLTKPGRPQASTAPVTDLVRDYENAIARGKWEQAALLLNGFSDDDIRSNLNKLTPTALGSLKNGALRSMPGWSNRVTDPIDNILITKFPSPPSSLANQVEGYFLIEPLQDMMDGIASACDKAFFLLNGLSNDDLRTTLSQLRKTTLSTLITNYNYALGKYDVPRLRAYMDAAWKTEFPEDNPPLEYILPGRTPGDMEKQFLQTVIPEISFPASEMSSEEKLQEALRRALPLLPGDVRQLVEQNWRNCVAMLSLVFVAQLNPFTAIVADVSLVIVGVYYEMNGEGFLGIIHEIISAASSAIAARSEADLNRAARTFADGFSAILVTVLVGLATGAIVKAGKAVRTRIKVSKPGSVIEEAVKPDEEPPQPLPEGIQKRRIVLFRGTVYGFENGPSRTAANFHDLDTGLYFTPDPEMATVYAEEHRVAAQAGQYVRQGVKPGTPGLVLKIELQPGEAGRVLDFYDDVSRLGDWENYLRSFGEPGELILAGRGSGQNYNSFFKGWVQKQGYTLNDFDMIVGPEYRLKGPQVCIRSESVQKLVLKRGEAWAIAHD